MPAPGPAAGAHPATASRDVDASGEPRSSITQHTLSDGEPVVLRDIVPGDEGLLLDLLEHVTGDSRWFRFFTGGADIRRAAATEAACGDAGRLGVVVLSADRTTILGHGMCVPTGGGDAEIAFEVADGQHRRGIGGVMLEHLIGRAREAGIRELVADVLPTNTDMLDLLTSSGRELRATTVDGVRTVRMAVASAPARPPSGQGAAPWPGEIAPHS